MIEDFQELQKEVSLALRTFQEDGNETMFLTYLIGLGESHYLNRISSSGQSSSEEKPRSIWIGRAKSERPALLAAAVAGTIAGMHQHLTITSTYVAQEEVIRGG